MECVKVRQSDKLSKERNEDVPKKALRGRTNCLWCTLGMAVLSMAALIVVISL